MSAAALLVLLFLQSGALSQVPQVALIRRFLKSPHLLWLSKFSLLSVELLRRWRSSSLLNIYIYLNLFERVTEKKEETDFPFAGSLFNGLSGESWAGLKPEIFSGSPMWVQAFSDLGFQLSRECVQ